MNNRDIFLCHASKDKNNLVRPIYEKLRSSGFSVWFDEAEIRWGDSIIDKIRSGLSTSEYVLICLTKNFKKEDGKWRFEELNTALTMQINSGKTKVIMLECGVPHKKIQEELPILSGRRYESIKFDANQRITTEELEKLKDLLKKRIMNVNKPLILDRDNTDRYVGTVTKRFKNVQRKIWISGNDCKFIVESNSPSIDKLLDRNVEVKILCLDPDSEAVEMLPLIDPRFHSVEEFKKSMETVQTILQRYSREFDNFEYRYLPILPALGFFITDPSLDDCLVKVEIYTSKPWEPLDSRPHLVFTKEQPKWKEYFINQWKNYWNMSRSSVSDH